jgi:muramidase (phage lysozyme)
MASALSAFVKGDKEIKDKLESMDSTLKKMYAVQVKGQKDEEKWRRRQEQAAKRQKADQKSPMGAFKNDKDDKKKGKGLFGKLFDFLSKNPALVKFLAALGGITVAALALKKAFEDLKNGTVIWWGEVQKQWTKRFNEQKQKWAKWWDDFKVKTNKGWKNFKTKTSKMFDDIANSRSFKDFKRGIQEAGEAFTKKFPGLAKALDDVKVKFGKFGKNINKKGGLLDALTNAKLGKKLTKGLGTLGKRLPAIGEVLFAGMTFKQRKEEGQGTGKALLGTGAEVTGGLAGAALGGKAGAALGATIGSFIAPGIGTAIGGALGGFSGAVLGGFGGAEFLGNLSDKLYPMIETWVQDTIVAPFSNLMQTIGKFWQVNVVEPFLANPVVKWLTPIVEAVMNFGKAFLDFQMALAGAIGRITGKIFDAIGNEVKYWSGVIGKGINKLWGKVTGWWEKDVEPWWYAISKVFSEKWDEFVEFLDPVIKKFEEVKEVFDKVVGFVEDKVISVFESLADIIQNKIVSFFEGPTKLFKGAADWLNSLGRQQGGVVHRQSGGPINVPGSGSGDTVPMMLPSNSFVMNRNAVHRQQGGLIPTMLEPGEQVYMPGQWGGMEMMMNSMFPRFQTGGEVTQASHPHTGSGWQPAGATDAEGRPLIFSKEAAQSFAKMMATGNVKGTDVASSQRSAGHNKTVRGVPNSAHLYGEAMDIHGSSKQWLIGNSEKYGWIRNNYMHDSWHWDYKGGGSGGEPPTGPVPMILAAGTNDVGAPVPAGKNVHDMIKVAKGKNYDVNFISPTAEGRFNEVSFQTSQRAREAGANTYMPQSWDADGYHIAMPEAANIKGMYPGATIIGDSNAARIEGTNGTEGRTKVGASTSVIKGFIDGLASGVHNESGERSKPGNNTNAITAGNIGAGLLNLGGDVGEFFAEILGGLGDILGDLGGSLLSGLANYGQGGDTNAPSTAISPGNAGAGAASINDPNAKALLNAIADAEGTSGMPNQGYNTHFGHGQTQDLSGHPRKIVNKGGYSSDAFGRYQFLSTTWDGVMGGSMEPARQDKGALKLVAGRKVNISDGLSESEVYRLGGEWASIEGGPQMRKGGSYGSQAKYSAAEFMNMYKGYGGKIQERQSGGTVTARPTSSGMVSKSQEQFIERMAAANKPVIVPVGMGGGGGGSQGGGMTGTGGSQTNVPNLNSHPSGNIALDNAFRLSLGAAFG